MSAASWRKYLHWRSVRKKRKIKKTPPQQHDVATIEIVIFPACCAQQIIRTPDPNLHVMMTSEKVKLEATKIHPLGRAPVELAAGSITPRLVH